MPNNQISSPTFTTTIYSSPQVISGTAQIPPKISSFIIEVLIGAGVIIITPYILGFYAVKQIFK